MSADPLFEFYKRARNRLRRHEPGSMLEHAVRALHEVHTGGIEIMKRYQPWNILLAMKWTLQEADGLSHRREPAKLNDFHAVLNVLHEIEGNVRMPNQYEHLNLFMRHLAFQQFWLQQGACGEALVRQDLLFAALPPEHYFTREFRRLTGIAASEFMEVAFALLTLVLQTPSPTVIQRSNFQILETGLSPGALDGFLRHISKTVPDLQCWLASDVFRNLAVADQKILPTPLLDCPLIQTPAGTYVVTFPTLVMRSLETVLYRTLRRADPAEFGVRFSPIFERYVARCLANAGVSFLNETQLKARLTGDGKCVDFLVTETDCDILIDAKGVEMSALGRVSQRADLVLRAIKDSAVKAIDQGMETATRLNAASRTIPGRETFLLVVTFDDLHLGSNFEFGSIFGVRLLPKLEQSFGLPLPIPLGHLFFVTIDELERMLVRVHAGTTTIGSVLRHARTQDSDPRTQKFNFQQHLDSLSKQEKRLPLLQAGLDDLSQRCIRRLPPELQASRRAD